MLRSRAENHAEKGKFFRSEGNHVYDGWASSPLSLSLSSLAEMIAEQETAAIPLTSPASRLPPWNCGGGGGGREFSLTSFPFYLSFLSLCLCLSLFPFFLRYLAAHL